MKLWLDFTDMSRLFQDTSATTPVTATTQPIGRINDRVSGAPIWTQGTTAAKPTRVTAGASFDGGDYLVTQSGKTYHRFLHDGTSWIMLIRGSFNRSAYIFNSTSGTGAVGISCEYDLTNQRINPFAITRGVSGNPTITNIVTANGSVPANTLGTLCIAYEYGRTGDDCIIYWDGTQIGSSESINAPATGDALRDLTLFSSELGTTPMIGDLAKVWGFTGVPLSALPTLRAEIAA